MDILHLKSPGNWINDPNGFIYYGGKYHLFYQHFPYAPVWGTMHWGHAISDDLVHWEHVGISIFPSKEYDRNGVFSGNALIKDHKLYLYYTGIQYPHPNPENIHLDVNYGLIASQCVLISEDGIHFDNFNQKKCLIPPSKNEEEMSSVDTRDPKVFYRDGKYYMILGSSHEGKGRLILLESQDALHFSIKAHFESEEFGGIFECPDYFELDGAELLFCAATDYLRDGLNFQAQEIYKFVDFNLEKGILTYEKESFYLDYGMDLYATQTTLDAEGNRVFIAWMRMPEPKLKEGGPWNGLMTMPRILSVRNHHLYFAPHPKVEEMFTKEVSLEELKGLSVKGVSVRMYEACEKEKSFTPYKIEAQMIEGGEISIGGYEISMKDGCIAVDRSKVYLKGDYRTKMSTPVLKDGAFLEIFVDEDIIEIYANHGEYVLSSIIYR